MQLYITTGVMLMCATAFIMGVVKLSNMKIFMHKRDLLYMKRFEAIEQMLTGDIKSILEILKNGVG